MKNFRLAILGLTMWTVTDCSDPTRTFAIYEINPLKDAFVSNNIRSYLEFSIERGKVEKRDSVTLDAGGNIESIINKGWWFSERHFKYDSLFRVVESIQESDMFDVMRFEYEPFPEKRLLVINTLLADRPEDKGVSIAKKLLEFDRDLKRILKKTEIDYKGDTTTSMYEYEYEDERLVREIKDGRINIEYIFKGDKLIEIKRLLLVMDKHGSFYVTDYISRQTGLIDSTVEKRLTSRTATYYKYYPR